MSLRIFRPLKQDHPVIGEQCPICRHNFFAGNRTLLRALGITGPGQFRSVQAALVHANCALGGARYPISAERLLYGHGDKMATITHIKDGDASPYPVVDQDGRQWKFSELGIDADEDQQGTTSGR